MISLDTPLAANPSIKRPTLARLVHLGLETVGDLLRHFPTRYEDYSQIKPLAEATPGERASFQGTITEIEQSRSFKKKLHLTTATIEDESGTLRIVWFNQKFLDQTLRQGTTIRLSGKVTTDRQGLLLQSPEWEIASRGHTHTARLIPVYPETAGVTSKFFRWQIESLFKRELDITDPMPEDILERLHLPDLARAYRMIHYPRTADEYEVARKRFAWDEMFLIQLKALQVREEWQRDKALGFTDSDDGIDAFITTLPFALTRAQAQAVGMIREDLARTRPMNRLLNGDVGSGKTIVAALACLTVARAGYQAALLAPTEVLARQHFESLRRLFAGEPFEVCLLTSSYQILGGDAVKRPTLLSAIRSGIPRIIIATHAILQKDLRFHNLALVIVDEQHRFGVAQRAYLHQSAASLNDGLPDVTPHFLTMTATPIPRTLALAFFGNLDVSLLNEMPADRKPIITKITRNQADRQYIYDFIRGEIKKGRQAFVILPLVETSEKMTEVKAATVEHDHLSKNIFPDLTLGLLHGKIKAKDKERIMTDFKEKKYDILVATAVVEVGIDIPNASVILIEEADRFGLSQLHQFRGRVGRGEHQSYCFLLPGTNASSENQRLEALEKTSNGFELAEIDLKLRGAGSLFGTRQSGLSDLAMASLGNLRLVSLARDESATLLTTDPHLAGHPHLAAALKQFDEKIHLE